MASNSNHQKMVPASPRLQLGQQERPSLAARFASAATITLVTSLCRAFLYGLNTVEVTGLDGFLAILDEREDPAQRQRGLITGKPSSPRPRVSSKLTHWLASIVSNHISR